MTVEEEVEDLLEDLTEYDDLEAMLAELEDDAGLEDLDGDGETFAVGED